MQNENPIIQDASNSWKDIPIFKPIFGDNWNQLPPVIKKHYAIRPYSNDSITVKGTLNVRISWFIDIASRLTGMLVPYSGDDIPVTVVLHSAPNSGSFFFDRIFDYPDHGSFKFRSRMQKVGNNELVEFMRFGIGWKLAYSWDGEKVILAHRGYVWRFMDRLIPIPLSWIMGRGHAEEIPRNEQQFDMWTHARHFLFGETFAYSGSFTIVSSENCCLPCDPQY